MNKLFFGIDTSNYTTSVSACDENGLIIANYKKMLTVKDGGRGLRQSDALFQHVVNSDFISESVSKILNENPCSNVAAVGYSARPRDVEGSYMPCFLAGQAMARVMSSSCGAELYDFSHQAGHVAAALYGSGALGLLTDRFAAFHVSGGTFDVLLSSGFSNGRFNIETVGGTKDLNAGQVIDRVGVAMGLPFPAGKHMEALAAGCDKKVPRYPSATDGLWCNLSGVENKSLKLYDETSDKALVASYVINTVSDVIKSLTDNLLSIYPGIPIVYSGGVMSCSIIRNRLSSTHRYFSPPEFSADNAAGVAYLTYLKYTNA